MLLPRCATAISLRKVRAPRSRPARHPPHGAWPAEMRANVAAAFLDYETTGHWALLLAITDDDVGAAAGTIPAASGAMMMNTPLAHTLAEPALARAFGPIVTALNKV